LREGNWAGRRQPVKKEKGEDWEGDLYDLKGVKIKGGAVYQNKKGDTTYALPGINES